MTAVAIIPARGGSRGIPGKNIKPLLGRPLIHWTLRAAIGCGRIDAVYVSTDDPAIAAAAEQVPGVRALPRAPETATDTASTESVLVDALARIPAFDDLVLIQATSPLLSSADLDRAFAAREAAGADSALSVVRQKRFLWRREAGGGFAPSNYEVERRPRRQDFEGFLVENGAFYIARRRDVLARRCRLAGRIEACEMDADSYVELDEPSDWRMVESLMAEHRTRRLAGIRLIACDVDGTLTDGGMYYDADGEALKKFNTRDAAALRALGEIHGVAVGAITAEDSATTRARCAKLGWTRVAHGCGDKVAVLRAWTRELGLGMHEVAYIGDDIGDLPALRTAGVSACPADASPACREAADLTMPTRGGEGCVRDFVETIAAAKRAAGVIAPPLRAAEERKA